MIGIKWRALEVKMAAPAAITWRATGERLRGDWQQIGRAHV